MLKNRFAILNYSQKRENAGGPSGYLFNLYAGLSDLKTDIDFLFVEDALLGAVKKVRKRRNFFIQLRNILFFIKKGIRMRNKFKSVVSNYDVIHVQSCEDCFYLKKYCKFKGKIIFTPHRPETYYEEVVSSLNTHGKEYRLLKFFFNRVEAAAYQFADAFIFPSVEAKNVYHSFPGFEKNTRGKEIKYVATGVIKKRPLRDAGSYRRDVLRLPEDKFVVAYIGRHNKIKGYDRLVDVSRQLIDEDIYIVVAGTKGIINPPNSDHWIELGYIKEIPELLSAVDVLVSPNRNTYYDLAIIEALAQGKIIVTSNTGGNIGLEAKCKAVITFDNNSSSDFLNKILDLKSCGKDRLKHLEKQAEKFFCLTSTVDVFAKNYTIAIQELVASLI